MNRPTCETCPYYDAEAKTTEIVGLTGIVSVQGLCKIDTHRRSHRAPDDFCGQHPQFPAYIASLSAVTIPPPDETTEYTREEINALAGMIRRLREPQGHQNR